MADKSTLEAIEKLKRDRPRKLLDTVDEGWWPDQDRPSTRKGLVNGLRFLVTDFRAQANLVMESGARGKGAEATALRSTASSLSLLADAVEQVDLSADDVAPTPSRGGPKLPAEWCGKTKDHGPHVWNRDQREGDGPGIVQVRECTGHQARDLSGLDALVAERAAKDAKLDAEGVPDFRGPGDLADPNVGAIVFAAPAFTSAMTGAMDAELEHERQRIIDGTDVEQAHTMIVERVPMPDYLKVPNPELESYLRGDDVAPVEPTRVNTPELKAEAAMMFAAPAPPGKAAEPEMPGRRLTFAELLAPAPVAPPEHMSHSQISGMSCGTQYRLTRLEPGVIERPRWANVGGTALHAAVEWFEKAVANASGNPQFVMDRIKVAGGIGKIWTDAFGNAVVEQSMKTPEIGPDLWKESGRHVKEGYTWWLTQGEDMLHRYLDGRLAEIGAGGRVIAMLPIGPVDASDTAPPVRLPAIEHEGMLDVEGVPVKIVIDQAWRTSPSSGDGIITIEDVKSGGWAPDGTFQLGLYAWYLRRTLGWDGQILGRFWDARKGTYGEPVDLIEAHPWEEVQLRVLPEAAKKKAGLFSPNPSFGGCKSCMVSHACPAAKATT